MATPPITFLEKKWAAGQGFSGSNHLVNAATQTDQRRRVPMLDRDTHRTITSFGRRTLMTLGRYLYWNHSTVRGTINEMSEIAAASCIPQFEGADQAWGKQVEDWLYEHDKIIDVRGWPFDMATYRENLVRSILKDGDVGTVLVKNADGYPMIQMIPAHRIGSAAGEETVKGGRWDGAKIIDGVIMDGTGRSLAYRVYADSVGYGTGGDYVDIDARDMLLSFAVEAPDQIRGISALGASCFDWQDVKEAREFELVAQKLAASIGLIETNETGEIDKTKALINRSSTNFDTTEKDKLTTTATETVDGVSVRYFRAGSNSKLETLQADRPTANQQGFRDDVVREALHGIGWSFDFSYNPTKIGGASMRVVVDRINRKLEKIRDRVIYKTMARIDGWRIASVMDNPARTDKATILFPFNEDWFRWSYQGPAKLTADAKYQSSVDIEERKAGMKTLAKSAAERGEYWKDLRATMEVEANDLLERAKRLADQHGISVETAIILLQDNTSYSTLTNSAEATNNASAAASEPTPTTDTP